MDEYYITYNQAGLLKHMPNGLCNIYKKRINDNYYEALPYKKIIKLLFEKFQGYTIRLFIK